MMINADSKLFIQEICKKRPFLQNQIFFISVAMVTTKLHFLGQKMSEHKDDWYNVDNKLFCKIYPKRPFLPILLVFLLSVAMVTMNLHFYAKKSQCTIMMIRVDNKLFRHEMSRKCHIQPFFAFCCHGNHEFAFLSQKSQCTIMMINVNNELFMQEIGKKCHICSFYLCLLSVAMVTMNLHSCAKYVSAQ